jgi:hypothetical protein
MPSPKGSISRWGPTIDIKIMQTNQRVEALKRSGRKFSSPMVVLGLIDTGASISALDPTIIHSLGLAPRDVVSVHTPTTGPAYEERWSYDAFSTTRTQTRTVSPRGQRFTIAYRRAPGDQCG